MNPNTHIPVLLKESIEYLNVQPDKWYVDATYGAGGHTSALLAQGAHVIAFDWDADTIARGQETHAAQLAAGNLRLFHEPFSKLLSVLQTHTEPVMGILFDFGTSTQQLTSSDRGFSVLGTGPLDMRMDTRLGVKAQDLLVVLSEKQLASLFKNLGGEHEAAAIARAIKRSTQPITTAKQLSDLIGRVKHFRGGHLHPATKVFQALRIAVNSELDEISTALRDAYHALAPAGRIVTIAFHEGEDRIAKEYMRTWEQETKGSSLTHKPVGPSEAEIEHNPRSRSAKLRACEKNGKTV